MKNFRTIVAAVLLIAAAGSLAGCDIINAVKGSINAVKSSSHTMSKAPVLKIYTVTDGGFTNTAYVVNHGGVEVVVSDPLGSGTHKVGDTIEYMAQKIEVRPGQKMLTFTYLK